MPPPRTNQGQNINVGDIFDVDFPDPIGRHMAIVTAVLADYIEVVYGQTRPIGAGRGAQHQVSKVGPDGAQTASGRRFGNRLVSVIHFRQDAVAWVVPALIGGMRIGAAMNTTLLAVQAIASAAALANFIRRFGQPLPSGGP